MATSGQFSPPLGLAHRVSLGFRSLRKASSICGGPLTNIASPSPTGSPLLRRVQMARLKCLMRSPIAKRVSPLQMDNSQSSDVSNSHYDTPRHSPVTMRKQDELQGQATTSAESPLLNEHAPLASFSSRLTTDSSSSENEEVSTNVAADNSSNQDTHPKPPSVAVNPTSISSNASTASSSVISRPRPASTLSHPSYTSNETTPSSLDCSVRDGVHSQDAAQAVEPHSAPVLRNASGTSGSIFLLAQHRANRRYLSYPLGDEKGGIVADVAGLKKASFAYQEVREVIVGRGEQDEKYGLKVDRIGNSVYITMILRSSMAASAGLKVGDQLIRINDRPVSRMTLDEVLNCFKHCQVAVKIAYRPRSVITRTRDIHMRKLNGRLGVRLQRRADGIYIDVVIPDSPAGQAGLKDGDQLLTINGDSVTRWSQERATRRLKETPNEGDILLGIREMLPMAHVAGTGLPPIASAARAPPSSSSSTSRIRVSRFTEQQWSGVAMSEPNSPLTNSRVGNRNRTSSSSISRSESPMGGRHRRTSERTVSQQLPENDVIETASKNWRASSQLLEDVTSPCSDRRDSTPTPGKGDTKWNVQNLSFNPQISYV